MNRIRNMCVGALLLGASQSALAQDFPPELQVVSWSVLDFVTGEETLVYQLDPPVGSPGAIGSYVHKELDSVIAEVRIFDFDWDIARNDVEVDPVNPPERPDYEGNFMGLRGFSAELFGASEFDIDFFFGNFFNQTGPISPPLLAIAPGLLNRLDGPGGAAADDEGFTPFVNSFPGDPGRPYSDVTFIFQLPEFVGRRQDRLQSPDGVLFDSGFIISFDAGPEETENTTISEQSPDFVIVSVVALIGVNDNPLFAPGNAPAFASGQAPAIVEAGTEVVLDGQRTFDASNVGFDQFESPEDNLVFERDDLTFAWEWLSGPERVEPSQTTPTSPFATVTLVEPGDYRFTLTVSDSSGNAPTTDTVKVQVVEKLAFNNAPVPFITGPTEDVRIGENITLDASLTTDADGDPLTFQWRQTNAFGEPLRPEELRAAFQPLSGSNAKISQWQAVAAGKYYFTLLVSDGTVRPTAQYVVTVQENSAQGAVDVDDSADLGDDLDLAPAAGPAGLCGAGLLPLALAPALLPLLRRRR